MTLIDWRDSRPIYEQIVERIKHLVLLDVLQPGEQLPSVRSLAIENGTNPNTVQKAYTELERQGVTYTVRGKGVFISDNTEIRDKKMDELIDREIEIIRECRTLKIKEDDIYRKAIKRLENGGES